METAYIAAQIVVRTRIAHPVFFCPGIFFADSRQFNRDGIASYKHAIKVKNFQVLKICRVVLHVDKDPTHRVGSGLDLLHNLQFVKTTGIIPVFFCTFFALFFLLSFNLLHERKGLTTVQGKSAKIVPFP